MNFLILVIVAVAGIALAITVLSKTVRSNISRCFRGWYFARFRGNRLGGQARRGAGSLITKQAKEKAKNKEKILEFLRDPSNFSGQGIKKIQNNDVQKLTGVSDATAERYLELARLTFLI